MPAGVTLAIGGLELVLEAADHMSPSPSIMASKPTFSDLGRVVLLLS
jgi:hypothetical protein